jgi:hypothetical protein
MNEEKTSVLVETAKTSYFMARFLNPELPEKTLLVRRKVHWTLAE